ncbi:hypothetical protein TNIN_721 [Trichonephila inaurata madagascariensis]|uniref:Uncharacterized protein n=1 Tax=Trichonephila inaurata madagascariensis TaxID=2747483 RepID=A0A8X7CEM2_9ARAC|nr:hypothetical protein TNIN_721 [Trichonephila inaurata madagascariensis]
MNDLEALKTRQIVGYQKIVPEEGGQTSSGCSQTGKISSPNWTFGGWGSQMMAMLLENSSGAPVIASSIIEIDEIMIRKLHLIMTTIACGHEIDAQKLKEFCLAPAKLYLALHIIGTTCFRASTKC